jgi:hypothetical protein
MARVSVIRQLFCAFPETRRSYLRRLSLHPLSSTKQSTANGCLSPIANSVGFPGS